MSDETRCAKCGDSGWVPSELGGSVPCGCAAPRMFLGGVFVSTPPSPAPRERGEETFEEWYERIRRERGGAAGPLDAMDSDAIQMLLAAYYDRAALRAPAPSAGTGGMSRAIVRQHAERMAGYVAKSYDEGRQWEELTRSGFWVGCIDNVLDALAALRAPAPSEAVAEDDRALLFAAWLTTRPGVMTVGAGEHAGPMAEAVHEWRQAHPAPARGVTVTEAMVERGLRMHLGNDAALIDRPAWADVVGKSRAHVRAILTAAHGRPS